MIAFTVLQNVILYFGLALKTIFVAVKVRIGTEVVFAPLTQPSWVRNSALQSQLQNDNRIFFSDSRPDFDVIIRMRGWFDLFRDNGGPTLYAYSNRTSVIGDVQVA